MDLLRNIALVVLVGVIMKILIDFITKRKKYDLKIRGLKTQVSEFTKSMDSFHNSVDELVNSYEERLEKYRIAEARQAEVLKKVMDTTQTLIRTHNNMYAKINIIADYINDDKMDADMKKQSINEYVSLINQDIKFNKKHHEIVKGISLGGKGHDFSL